MPTGSKPYDIFTVDAAIRIISRQELLANLIAARTSGW
jgi:hypothetical protein